MYPGVRKSRVHILYRLIQYNLIRYRCANLVPIIGFSDIRSDYRCNSKKLVTYLMSPSLFFISILKTDVSLFKLKSSEFSSCVVYCCLVLCLIMESFTGKGEKIFQNGLLYHLIETTVERRLRMMRCTLICDRVCENRACGHKLHLFT